MAQTLLTYLTEQFQRRGDSPPGQDPPPSQLDLLYAELPTRAEKLAAHKAIEWYVSAGEETLSQDGNPVTSVAMTTEGVGLNHADGTVTEAGPRAFNTPEGTLEQSAVQPITVGLSTRGQEGVQPSPAAIPVTSGKQEMALREP